MAADILAYRATHVPVGDDQKQHLELARDIAQKFNHDYLGEDAAPFFPLPEPVITGAATRVMSLRDGSRKMSKSEPSEMSRITLTDDADEIAKKIRKAKTDPDPLPTDKSGLEGRPEASNLVGIFASLSGQEVETVLAEYGGRQFSDFKPALADLAVEMIAPIGAEMSRLLDAPEHLETVLADGAARAEAIAGPVLAQVKEMVGFSA